MHYTGWAEIFSRAHRDLLIHISELPFIIGRDFHSSQDKDNVPVSSYYRDEQRLKHLILAVDRRFNHCKDIV